ncbi:hydroxypyruvate isomerase family protein [Mucilaginibacter ximonensis]|uniref:Hydroxypyruvate isomerase family protein n=1 Tax=Mucilaginibacter ximonensis TaxID=538021 RepID=A0ABW5YER5_9SPHI
MRSSQNRRSAIKNILAGTGAVAAAGTLSAFKTSPKTNIEPKKLKGNINHSVCRWCFQNIDLDSLCKAAADMGMKAIDLIGPDEWAIAQKHGLYSSMCNGPGVAITFGWNDPAKHEKLIKDYSDLIPKVAAAGYKNLICFSGNREGKDDETGLQNCVTGLKKILPLAEKHGVVMCMELLNSKVDHHDYQCDHTEWGVKLCKALGSENFKLLYDIYHMQIDEGNVIANIRKYHDYLAHFHVAGVPGRHDPNDTQELYYPAIIKAIKDLGFKGYVAQEYLPTTNDQDQMIASLKASMMICDV